MRKSYLINIIILLCIITSSNRVEAAGSRGTSGADFLELGVGARSIAMGEAFVAMSKDLNTLFYNPAGLGTLKFPSFSIEHQGLIVDSRMETIYGSIPFKKGYFGVGTQLFWVPPFEKIDVDGNGDGKVNFYNSNNIIGYGRRIGSVYLGASFKYIYQRIDTLNTHSAAVDFGILKRLRMYSPFESPARNFTLGMSLQNIGTKVKNDPLPGLLRIGSSYLPTNWLRFNLDIVENFIDSSDLYDFTYGFDESFRVHTGVELNYYNILALRAGYRWNDGVNYTFGCGFNYVIQNIAFHVDTAYANTPEFGPTYSMNITFKLIPKVVTQEDKKISERYYQQGIKYYVADDLESSLESFKKSQDFNPYHKNVGDKIEDLEEIQKLRKEEEKIDIYDDGIE